jgi:hypothetical protein
MSHIHWMVVLVGVRYDFSLEAREYLRHGTSLPGKLFGEPPRQLLGRARGRDLTFPRARRFEIARRYSRKLFSDFERGIGLELGKNVIDHPANLLLLRVEQSVLADEVGELAPRPHAQFQENVGEMSAHCARGDLERSADFLV